MYRLFDSICEFVVNKINFFLMKNSRMLIKIENLMHTEVYYLYCLIFFHFFAVSIHIRIAFYEIIIDYLKVASQCQSNTKSRN